MLKLTKKEQNILSIIVKKGVIRSSEVYSEVIKIGEKTSLVTVKRALSLMVHEGLLISVGSGRSTSYDIGIIGRMFLEVNAHEYCSIEPDKRYGSNRYNFDLLSAWPANLFTDQEMDILNHATDTYKNRTNDLPATIQKKELERLIIELSWKSSKIEGNTYTLLDTEKLILENKEASGHSKREAKMILNHKDAFNFIRDNTSQFKTLTKKNLEEVHAIMVNDLSVGLGLRQKPVGVTGSIYRPLDNIHQISEAVNSLSTAISRMSSPYAKALTALLGISYIQPFEDGNKRTSRLMANALLIADGLTPLSYRSVDEVEYREAILVFYELNSIIPFKKIFIEQYSFAANNYAVQTDSE